MQSLQSSYIYSSNLTRPMLDTSCMEVISIIMHVHLYTILISFIKFKSSLIFLNQIMCQGMDSAIHYLLIAMSLVQPICKTGIQKRKRNQYFVQPISRTGTLK